MRPDYDSLIEGQRRDLELAAALQALPKPELPEDMDDRLRRAVEKERRRNRRRPGWREYLALILIAAAVIGSLAWRYAPPASGTMEAVRATLELRKSSLIPSPPPTAISRGRLTIPERRTLEKEVIADVKESCTPRFAREQILEERLPQHSAQVTANILRSGQGWQPDTDRLSAAQVHFVRRNWDGSLVVRARLDDAGDFYVLRRVRDQWLIDEIIHSGS